ncbi:hypothetical protein KI387_007587, partial [Taxus chinensis]
VSEGMLVHGFYWVYHLVMLRVAAFRITIHGCFHSHMLVVGDTALLALFGVGFHSGWVRAQAPIASCSVFVDNGGASPQTVSPTLAILLHRNMVFYCYVQHETCNDLLCVMCFVFPQDFTYSLFVKSLFDHPMALQQTSCIFFVDVTGGFNLSIH